MRDHAVIMVETQLVSRGISDRLVLDAMRRVPRHLFVPPGTDMRDAYGDHPLPIGMGQTISQPYIIALMLESLALERGDRVLEIGTGSGYQTAVLSEMGMDVVSLDILPELCASALSRLVRLGLAGRARIICADGWAGWEPAAPYAGIVVSAAPPVLPGRLPAQLSAGGRLSVPVGPVIQQLVTVERTSDGFARTAGEHVRFVPLLGRPV